MNTKQIERELFYSIIERSGAELTGSDVGRTHGIHQYTRSGRAVGWSSFYKSEKEMIWKYEIAQYLYEAYAK